MFTSEYATVFVSGIPVKVIVSVIDLSSFTVRSASDFISELSAKVAVITTTPLSMSVTLPFSSIVATSSSPEVQRTFPLPLSNFTPSCSVFSVSVMVTIPFSGTPVIERPVTDTSSVHAIAKIIDNDNIAIRRYTLILFVLFIFLHLFLYSILAMLYLHRVSIISYGNLLFYK